MVSKGIGKKTRKQKQAETSVKTFKSKLLKTDNFDQILDRENGDLKYKSFTNQNAAQRIGKPINSRGSVKQRASSAAKPSVENRWLKDENDKLR